jgi:hypothetical protein
MVMKHPAASIPLARLPVGCRNGARKGHRNSIIKHIGL